MTACAMCAHENAPEYRTPVTEVGVLPVCGSHVEAALHMLGYRTDTEVANVADQIVAWLDSIDPLALQQQAIAHMDSVPFNEAQTGAMYIAALKSAAVEAKPEDG